MREIYAKYSGGAPKQRPGVESPATFDTPQNNPNDTPMSSTSTKSGRLSRSSTKSKDKSPSDGHSLDSFLATHTSEDNQSFQELIEAADRKLRQKFAVLYQAEQDTSLAVASTLQLPSIEKQFDAIEGVRNVSFVCNRSMDVYPIFI